MCVPWESYKYQIIFFCEFLYIHWHWASVYVRSLITDLGVGMRWMKWLTNLCESKLNALVMREHTWILTHKFSWQFDREAASHSGCRVHSTFKFLLVRDCLVTTHWSYAVDQVYKVKPERVWTEENCRMLSRN
jgi:hypothetical protein